MRGEIEKGKRYSGVPSKNDIPGVEDLEVWWELNGDTAVTLISGMFDNYPQCQLSSTATYLKGTALIGRAPTAMRRAATIENRHTARFLPLIFKWQASLKHCLRAGGAFGWQYGLESGSGYDIVAKLSSLVRQGAVQRAVPSV